MVGGFFFARPAPLFLFLGTDAYPHVFPDRNLGARPEDLCRGEIYPVHHVRLDPDAGCDSVALQPGRDVRCAGYSSEAANGACFAAVTHRTSAFRGFLSGVCHQSATVPAAYLASGRTHRSAHGGFRDSRGSDAETGHLRDAAILLAAVSG